MRSIIIFLWALVLLGSSVFLPAQTSIPAVIDEEESSVSGAYTGQWSWNGHAFEARWDNSAVAILTVQSFTPSSVIIVRTDTPGTTSSGLTARYVGQISATGDSIINGTVVWTWPGVNGYPHQGTWTAHWIRPINQSLGQQTALGPSPVASSETGTAYIPSYGSNDVSVVDLSTNTVLKTIHVSAGARYVAVSRDGKRAYVTVDPNLVVAIDTATNIIVKSIQVGQSPLGIAVLPDSSAVYVANSTDGTVSVISAATLSVIDTIKLPFAYAYPTGLGVSADGAHVYVSSGRGPGPSPSIDVISSAGNSVVASFRNPQQNTQIAISADGATGYAAGVDLFTGKGNVSVFNTADGTILATIPMGASHGIGIALSSDGSKAYATDENSVYVIDTLTKTVADTIATGGALGISLSQDGTRLYVADGFSGLKTVDTKTRRVISRASVGNHPIAIGSFIRRNGGVAKIILTGATTHDAQSVTVNYTIEGGNSDPIRFDIYRSDQPQLTSNSVKIGTQTASAPDFLSLGDHWDVSLVPGTSLPPNTFLPYVVIIASNQASVSSTFFHKYLLAVVVHGYTLFFPLQYFPPEPDWEPQMQQDLTEIAHYDKVIISNWVYESSSASEREPIYAGNALYNQILAVVRSVQTAHNGDVVDIHFIGHSRGTVVISEILKDLVNAAEPALRGSYDEVSLLDPHPANNEFGTSASVPTSTDSILFAGLIVTAMSEYVTFQSTAKDDAILLPAHAGIKNIDIWYQHTPADEFPELSPEHLLNLWGHGPNDSAIQNQSGVPITWHNLSSKGDDKIGKFGHSEVHEYYRVFVVDLGVNRTY